MKQRTAWSARATELLADGELHDGLTVVREAEKQIPPGIGQRYAERARMHEAVKRYGKDAPEKVLSRKKPISATTQIALGRRLIMQTLVSSRVKKGTWRLDAGHPLPEGAWRGEVPWAIQNLSVFRVSITDFRRTHQLAAPTLEKIIVDNGLEDLLTTSGRTRYIPLSARPEFEQAVIIYKDDGPRRRSIAAKRGRSRERTEANAGAS